MRILSVIVIITSISAILINNISLIHILLLIIATAINIIGFRINPINKNYTLYFMWFLYWMSVIFMPAFRLVEPGMKDIYIPITQEWNDRIIAFGIPVYLLVSILLCVPHKYKSYNYSFRPRFSIKPKLVSTLIIISIGLSLFSISTGLGRMGSEAIVLPFHLGGIINLFRSSIMPVFFCVAVENFRLRRIKFPRKLWLLYIFWCLLEIFAWMSKSIFVLNLLPALMYLYFSYKPRIKSIFMVTVPLSLFFIVLYPIIGTARHSEFTGSIDVGSFVDAYDETRSNDNETNPLLTPLNRTFGFGSKYAQDYNFINHNDLFDFSKVPILFSYNGAAKFQTHFIDGYPETARHSSGTNGLIDPLLHGGIGLLLIIILLNFFLARCLDNWYNKRYYGIVAILLYPFFVWISLVNISNLYTWNGIVSFTLSGMFAYLAYKINLQRK